MKEKIFQKELLGGAVVGASGLGMLAAWGQNYGMYAFSVMLLMAVLGCGAAVGSVILPGVRRTPLERILPYEVLFLLILAACPLLLERLGFFATAALALFGISGLSMKKVSLAGVLKLVLYVSCVTAAAYLVFAVLLRIHTPRGWLF